MCNFIKISTFVVLIMAPFLGFAHGQETVESGHVAVENPATLSQSEANKIYDEIRGRMARGYELAGLSIIEKYQSWKRYNSAPYISATHGQRFVNSYANRQVKAYGNLSQGEKYPVGSVFAKDSLTVTDDNKIYPGAMFVMEKLATGTHPETADWRYVMILPDGTTFGDTTGTEAELVEYCHECHEAKAEDDYVFYVPEKFQIK